MEYTYDDNQRLTEEKTTTTFSNPAKKIITYKKYNYNVYGEVVRTESYVEGEELTTGKTIEETVFDAYGNAIKSYTYNSLDSSSKLYTESEYSEDGKVLSDFDETGEYKTQYKYADGAANINEDILPNGSRFAYGYDNDTVTAISHSTEEGVENSTQRIYNYGEVVGLRSGNTDVQYKYNHKRKLISVGLNGDAVYVTYNRVEKTNTVGAVTGETVTATYSSGDVFVSETDGDGNVLKTTANGVVQSENVYEKKSLLILKDKIAGKNYYFAKDDLDRLTEVYEVNDSDARISGYTEKYEYDSYGSLIKKTIAEGDLSQEYTYTYNTDAKRAIASIAAGGITVKPQLDKLERNKGKELYISGTKVAEEIISYRKAGDHATNMPSVMSFGNMQSGKYVIKDSIRYAYDEMGNITKVYENGELAARYKYDALSRLIREDNKEFEKTWLYSYDNKGNILKQRAFAFTMKDEEELEELTSESREYVYKGDRLESYNGEACEYNEAGNPRTYRGTAATWTNGRLASYKGATFTYDGQGRRASKVSVTYMYDSQSRLIKQSNGLEYYYDHSGVCGVKYNGNTYIYRKDIQGNICAILDSNGSIIVQYKYDAWGNHAVLDANGADITEATHIGNINPFRYRGYYYDTETGLYYLKSRYYDPETGRFISIDDISYLDPETINGLNLYSYCGNNPVMNVDPEGMFWGLFFLIVGISALLIGTGVAIYAGVTAYNNGYRGWDLAGAIARGFLAGAAAGALIGALIAMFIYAAPAIGSFLSSTFTLGYMVTATGAAAAITVTGAQIAAAGAAAAIGLGIMFARIGKSGGYNIDHHYPNDHDPTHVHISGDDGKTRVDLNGNPLPGDRPMTFGERKAFWRLIDKIREVLKPWIH